MSELSELYNYDRIFQSSAITFMPAYGTTTSIWPDMTLLHLVFDEDQTVLRCIVMFKVGDEVVTHFGLESAEDIMRLMQDKKKAMYSEVTNVQLDISDVHPDDDEIEADEPDIGGSD